MNIKKLTLILILFLFLLETLPASSAGRGRLRIAEVSPNSQITLNENSSEAILTFTVDGMIISPSLLAMIMTAGGIPVEVKLIPSNPNLDLSAFTVEPASGLITFDIPSREFGTFETKIKLNPQTNQRTSRNLITRGAFSCERENGTLQPQGNIATLGNNMLMLGALGNIVINCMGEGLTGETMIDLSGSTGNTSIATVAPEKTSVNVSPDGTTEPINFIINVLMVGQTDVAFDFSGSRNLLPTIITTLWDFQASNTGGGVMIMGLGGLGPIMGGSDEITIISSAANGFRIVVEDGISPKGAIMSFTRRCNFSPAVQDTSAFATCP